MLAQLKKNLAIITINFFVFVALLACIELAGQILYRLKFGMFFAQPYIENVIAHKSLFEQHPYLVARPKNNIVVQMDNKTISTTTIHTRRTGIVNINSNAIKIAVVGGSTTFGTNVTDSESWPWLLQEMLGSDYQVINYGVPGYSTAEAIIQMSLIIPEEMPDIVVFYEGWNDIRNYHWQGNNPDYFNHGMSQFSNLLAQPKNDESALDTSAKYFVLAKNIKKIINLYIEKNQIKKNPPTTTQPSTEVDPAIDKIYLRNLVTLNTLTNRFGATSIFIPQVLNFENFTNHNVEQSWTPYIDNNAMFKLMTHFNKIMSNTCAGQKGNCYFNGEVLLEPWNQGDFVDDGHFSKAGGEKMASQLAKKIRNIQRTKIPKNKNSTIKL